MTVAIIDYKHHDSFVHLHAHSIYSPLDGCCMPSEYARECSKRGYPAMAITEHGNMGSVPDMYFELKKAKVKFIPGYEAYFCDYEPERARLGKGELGKLRTEDNDTYMRLTRARHLTILAKNHTGFTNLIKLSTQAYRTGFYRKPRIWFDKLLEHKEGLIVLSGCLNGPVCHELRLTDPDGKPTPRLQSKDKRGAIDWIRRFRAAFGPDFYVELQMPGVENDVKVFKDLVAIADHLKIGTVLSNDAHYLDRAGYELQTIMMAIDQGTTIDSPTLWHVNSSEQYLKTRPELWTRFKNAGYGDGLDDGVFERACDNTLAIADKCEKLEIDVTPKIPTYKDADTRLRHLVAKALRARGLDKNQKRYLIDGRMVTYVEQAALELERIIDKGYASYFIITHDLVAYGRKRGWPFSPRGSAGGSEICYLLGISSIDSMKWGLSFDRFLSPSRGGFLLNINMPAPVRR